MSIPSSPDYRKHPDTSTPASSTQNLTPSQQGELYRELEALQQMIPENGFQEWNQDTVDKLKNTLQNWLAQKPPLSPAIQKKLKSALSQLNQAQAAYNTGDQTWMVDCSRAFSLLLPLTGH